MDNAHLKKTWQKGIKALEQRDFARAVASLKKVAKVVPEDPEVHFALADALLGQGRVDQAIRQCQAGVDCAPEAIVGRIRMGRLLLMAGKGDRALETLTEAQKVAPDHPHVAAGIAEARAMTGDLAGAEEGFSAALALAPGQPDLMISLARVQDARGDTDAAEKTLRQACQEHPAELPLWQSLGRALTAWDRLEDASEICSQAQQHHPRSAELMALRAELAYQLRDLELAQELFTALLKTRPDDPWIQNDLAQVLASLGEDAESGRLFRQLTERQPLFGQPWLNIARARRYGDTDDTDIRQMRSVLKRRQMDPSQALYVHFALGKAFDDCRAYDEAFTHYQKGNALRRASLQFDPQAVDDHISRIIEAFSPEFMNRFAEQGDPSTRPLMIVGMPRSGTTLLEQVLCAHPDVTTAGELRELVRIARTFTHKSEQSWPECIEDITAEDLNASAKAYLGALSARSDGAARVVDKMPQNFLHLGLAALLFPNVTLVHCVRDPLDTCLSNFFQVFPPGIDFAYNLSELGHYYRGYERLMTHWHSLVGARLVTVRYEELVSDPESVLRPLLKNLGLDWEPACLAHQENVQRVDTLSLYQVRQPLNTGSTKRWRHYEKHLAPLRQALAGEA
ncbi:MAG: hypothetical protein CL389_10855 [Acidiferrobacteraceae bacterium]|jgi:Flp pilus assembly protein TadD|nr:hypothetical protein [Acidiferrobacteraceae bacterium]MDP6398586.1 sulfotransferase [Arenicellales bacterium]MDP6552989.1 sulfotransferase [Arenicellales bacterium]MDP6918833.1 sulfotransferase [Arenicellales bacterium]|tara:strand:- start:31946 stop:33817 length:1872 start_codon:yes stop_codon:yes gene_type:complete